ncbi:MAG: SDR family NAD(P)-dependent oxidoreductase [Myxococcota bacterium]|nr:SDR family NAD(P)-dependent oxidoreductase [Myxococcota bacterium]
MQRLGGKRAFVTGGGRGIGRGISLALAGAGADVALADVDLESAESTAKEIEGLGRRSLVVRVDVTDAGSVREGVARAIRELGGVEILVNNAGVVQDRIGLEAGDDDFERCYAVNLKGVWNVTAALLPHFREHGGGRVVNIASIAGRRGVDALAPYAASKAAAISLTQSLASALGPENVNVNAVCPGLLWTPMWEKLEGMFRRDDAPEVVSERAAFDAFIQANCPLRREQTPEDIGHAVVFLASDEARNITGQSLNVDGGIQMN